MHCRAARDTQVCGVGAAVVPGAGASAGGAPVAVVDGAPVEAAADVVGAGAGGASLVAAMDVVEGAGVGTAPPPRMQRGSGQAPAAPWSAHHLW
mmetsp:Transcript_119296/g.331566  ORF Transcript_119296/g.331566 Transcript_119296/m.331566 type:complete len:94 (-) Transcript_119296:504-785(-)